MTALDYEPLDSEQTLYKLGDGIYVATSEQVVVSPLIDFDRLHPEVVTYNVVEAIKYVVHGPNPYPCPPNIAAPKDRTHPKAFCTRMPPYNDSIPVPSTVFGKQKALKTAGVVVHQTNADAIARIRRGTAPTGFWLLETDDKKFVTIEVGLNTQS